MLQTSEMANSDLEKYYIALDKYVLPPQTGGVY